MAAFNPLDILARLRSGGSQEHDNTRASITQTLPTSGVEESKRTERRNKKPQHGKGNMGSMGSFQPTSSGARLASHALRGNTTTPEQAHAASPIMQSVRANLGATRAQMGSPGLGDGRPISASGSTFHDHDSSSDSDSDSSSSGSSRGSSRSRRTSPPVLLNFGTERSFSSEEIRAKLEGEIHRLQGQLNSSRREVDTLRDERNEAKSELTQVKEKAAVTIRTVRAELGKMTVKFNNAVAQLGKTTGYRNNRPLSGQMQPFNIRDVSPSKQLSDREQSHIATHLQIASAHTLPGVAAKSFMGPTFSELMRLQGSEGAANAEKRGSKERQHAARALTSAAASVAANNVNTNNLSQQTPNSGIGASTGPKPASTTAAATMQQSANNVSSSSSVGNNSNGATAAAAAVASLVGENTSALNIMDLHVADPFQGRASTPATADDDHQKKEKSKKKKKEKSDKKEKKSQRAAPSAYDEDGLGNFTISL